MSSVPSHAASTPGATAPTPSSGSQIQQVMGPGPATAASTPAASSPHAEPPLHTLVPRLELNGSNWAAFQMRFSEAMDAADRWGHFDGTEPRPGAANPKALTTDELAAQKRWDREDKISRNLLLQRLHDTTAMRLKPLSTARERWTRLSQEYQAKSVYAQTDLQQAFFDMRCAKDGDVRAFLQALSHKREELAAAGAPVSDSEYQRTILRGIPDDLARFASQLLASTRLASPSSPVDVDTLIIHICEEADRTRNRRARGQTGQGRGKKDQQPDEALAATGSDAGRKKRRKGKCHYCQKEGHWERECRKKLAEQGGQNNQSTTAQGSGSTTAKPETKPVGAVNAVSDADIEGDGFWMVIEGELTVHALGPDPDMFLGSDSEWEYIDDDSEPSAASEDWLQEVEDMAAASIAPMLEDTVARTELFDSGATRHISPFKGDFTTFPTRASCPPHYC
jgi:hypothetical protein